MKEKQFVIKSYGFGELACLYVPHISKKSAATYLNRMVRNYPELRAKLLSANYKTRQKILTPLMVSIFVEFMGEP